MKICHLIVAAFILNPDLASAAEPAKPAATQALVESKPVAKDGVSIVVSLKQQTISTSAQPQFTVRFTNTATDYINLYDIDAWCDWNIEFASIDKKKDQPQTLALKMDKIPHRIPIAHKQIKPVESLDVNINLNDPPFTFHYETARPADHAPATSIRHLTPGTYQVILTIKLNNPFGKGYHQWEGPLTTEPIELIVRPSTPEESAPPTPEQAAAYSAAIRRTTDKIDSHGLWLNGTFPQINLPSDAKPEDAIEAAVNQTSLESKAYRILKVEPFKNPSMPENVSGSAAVVQVGKAYKIVIFYPFEKSGWWTRFYDAEITPPAVQPAAGPR
jgi:hypothetical protein